MKSLRNKNKCVSVSFVEMPVAKIARRKQGFFMMTHKINQWTILWCRLEGTLHQIMTVQEEKSVYCVTENFILTRFYAALLLQLTPKIYFWTVLKRRMTNRLVNWQTHNLKWFSHRAQSGMSWNRNLSPRLHSLTSD